jgi:glycosyltransferase involved in cell wall biosynthesis
VESALRQTWKPSEVIVVDDCSTDGTYEELKHFGNTIRVEKAPERGGQNVTRNRLTELSSGEWLIYLDADDELDNRSVELKMRFSDEADAIYGSINLSTYDREHEVESQKIVARDYSDACSAAFAWKFPNTSAFCFKREAVIKAGGWNEQIKNCTDYDLYFRLLLKQYRFKAAHDAWSTYRQWSATQAVNEDPLRKMLTRFELMLGVAMQLKAAGELTPNRRRAFFDASLGVLRTIYPLDSRLAVDQHERLLTECPECHPSKDLFPARYRLFYETIGFSSAERIAELVR